MLGIESIQTCIPFTERRQCCCESDRGGKSRTERLGSPLVRYSAVVMPLIAHVTCGRGRPPLTCRGAVVRHPPQQLHLVLIGTVTPELVEPGWGRGHVRVVAMQNWRKEAPIMLMLGSGIQVLGGRVEFICIVLSLVLKGAWPGPSSPNTHGLTSSQCSSAERSQQHPLGGPRLRPARPQLRHPCRHPPGRPGIYKTSGHTEQAGYWEAEGWDQRAGIRGLGGRGLGSEVWDRKKND